MPRLKPRLPVGGIQPFKSGRPRLSKFHVSKVRWEKLETALDNRAIPEEARREINTAIKRFLLLAYAEHSKSPLSESIEHIKLWKRAAEDFLAALTAPGDAASIFYAQYFVQQEFSDLTLDELHDIVMAYRGACVRAMTEAASMAVPGPHRHAWDTLIKDLRKIFALHGWRPTARKDWVLNTARKPSRLVSFVGELQQLIPPKYRRGTQSSDALAGEIRLALRSAPTEVGTKRSRRNHSGAKRTRQKKK